MSRMSERPPGSCWSTGAESCRAYRSRSPHSCWESRAPLSRRGGRKACSSRRSSVCVTRSPWTMILASSAAYRQLRLARCSWMIRSHVVGDEVQDQTHPTRRERLPGAGERASSTEMIIDNVAAYAVGRSHNVVGLPIGKSRVEADPQVVICQRDPGERGSRRPAGGADHGRHRAAPRTSRRAAGERPAGRGAAVRTLAAVEEHRSTWQICMSGPRRSGRIGECPSEPRRRVIGVLGVITYSPLGGGLLTGKYGMVQIAPRGTHSPICLDLSAVLADPRHCRSPRAPPWLYSPSRWPPRRVVADGRRTPDRAAAVDVTDPCADQDRASRRSAGD